MKREAHKLTRDNRMALMGNVLRLMRQGSGLSQNELAHLLGTKRTAVSRWEHGVGGLSIDYAMEIAEIIMKNEKE